MDKGFNPELIAFWLWGMVKNDVIWEMSVYVFALNLAPCALFRKERKKMKKFCWLISLVMIVSLLGACQSAPPPNDWTIGPLPVPPASPEPPPLKVTLPTTLPAMLSILQTRIYFTGSGYQPNEMVVVKMDVPPGVEIPGVKPGEPVGVASANADGKGNFTADVDAETKIQTFLRGKILPTRAPDPGSLKPIPHGMYTFRSIGTESGKVGVSRIEFVSPAPK